MKRIVASCFFAMWIALTSAYVYANMPKVQHRQICENPGTSEEIIHGSLSIGGYDVPDKFQKVTYDERTFEFVQRTKESGNDGYMEIDYEPIVESEELMKLEMLRKGFYIGEKRLKNTPLDWIFVIWGNDKSAFVGWQKIYTLYGEYDVPDLPRKLEG